MKGSVVPLVLMSLGLAVSAALARAPLPQFAGETALESLRLSMPAMRGARDVPAKPLQVFVYQVRLGDESWEERRSPAIELWRAAQTAGTWVDRAGNELTLARARFSFPALGDAVFANDPKEAVTQEAFDGLVADSALALDRDADQAVLGAWTERFAGVAGAGAPVRLAINGSRLAALWEVPLSDPAVRAYLFRFDSNHAGQAGAEDAWFAVFFRFASAPPADGSADRLLRNSFLSSLHAHGRFGGSNAEDPRRHPRPSERGKNPAPVPEDARRKRARATIELMDAWWHMDSPHYILLCDIVGGDAAADRLLAVLENLRPRYAALVPSFPKAPEETSVVRFFRDEEEFLRYFEGTPLGLSAATTAGWFDSSRGELVVRPARKGSGADPETTLRHEGFHQWLDGAWPQTRAPMWFNEGTAEFFECYVPCGSGRSFEWKENPDAAAVLERLARSDDVDWTRLLQAVLLADQAAFYNPPWFGGDASLDYAFAWGLMYFLHRGAPQLRNEPWKDVLPTFYRTLYETRDPTRATLAAFRMGADGTDLVLLERLAVDLRTFWRNDSARRDARSARIP